jgi:hypothetical protein
LQALPGSDSSHVADELHECFLFTLSHLSRFCRREWLPVSSMKVLLAARATAAPQALHACLTKWQVEMGFVPENGIGL